MKNYKIIILPTGKDPTVSDLTQAQYGTNNIFTIIDIINNRLYFADGWDDIEDHKAINIHIIDTNATIKENNYYWNVDKIRRAGKIKGDRIEINTFPHPCYMTCSTTNSYKIIATTDPNLNLPLLSKQAVETIIKHNGNINEFHIEFKCGIPEEELCRNYLKSCMECEFSKVNIILPTTGKQDISVEELENAAYDYKFSQNISDHYWELRDRFAVAFKAGAEWYKNQLNK